MRCHQRVLGVARQDAAAGTEQPQRRRVPTRPGCAASAASSGRALASPTRFIALTRFAFDEIEHVFHVDVRTVVQHDLAAAEQRADRRPLPARVHERPERERHELRRTRVALGEERSQALRGIVEHRHGDVDGPFDRRTARVPAAHRAEEDVLVPPQHALRHAGRAAGVQHVVVVGGARAEVARRRRVAHQRRRTSGSSTSSTNRTSGQRGATRAARSRPARVVDDPDRVGVVEQVLELVVDVAVVHVDRDRARLVAREHRLEMLDRVVHEQRDVRARAARRGRRARARAGSIARRARRRCAVRRRRPRPRDRERRRPPVRTDLRD